MARVTIRLGGVRQWEAALDRLARAGGLAPVLREIGEAALEDAQERFRSETGPEGPRGRSCRSTRSRGRGGRTSSTSRGYWRTRCT